MTISISDTLGVFLLFWLVACSFAIWRGGAPERIAAALNVAALPTSMLAAGLQIRFHGVNLGSLTVDVAFLIGLCLLALKANRYWPMAMAGLQTLAVFGSLLKFADPDRVPALIYWLSKTFWAYPILALLVIATVRHRYRVRASGPEPSWNTFSPGSTSIRRQRPRA